MKDFITEYLIYNQGNMSPKRYHRWCALMVLSCTMGRRIYVDHSYFRVHPMLYITLVGRQGIRKTSAMNNAKDMLLEVFPDYPVGASVMSREQIVGRLCSDDCLRAFQDENGNMIEFKPTAFFINELKNFMSINPSGMVDFLTDIYDVKAFNADTIKHGLQPILHPCVNILACETPKWLIEKLKMNIIAGGFSRRMIYAYETERPNRITFPHKSHDSRASELWCKEHLKKIKDLVGPMQWEPSAREFLDQWFKALPHQDDEILEGYYEAKDILAQKIAMLLAVGQEEPKLVFTTELLELAIAFLEANEDNLPKLTVAAGRNELAIPQQQLMDHLIEAGGIISEKKWHREAGKNLSEMEYANARRFFKETDQIFEVQYALNGAVELCIANAETFTRMIKEGKIQAKKK